jgi:hypothetical protein
MILFIDAISKTFCELASGLKFLLSNDMTNDPCYIALMSSLSFGITWTFSISESFPVAHNLFGTPCL